MALGDYERGLFGGMRAPARSKELLLKDLERMEKGQLGLSAGEQRQLREGATQQAGAILQAQQQEAAQAGLAGGPLASVSGRGAALQRELGGQMAQAGALASSEAARLSQEKAMAEKASILGRLSEQQDRARQNAQFWAQWLVGQRGGLEAAAPALSEAGSTLMAAGMAACWVAEELFGVYDARTDCARWYVATHDGWFLRLYRQYGRTWAAWLRTYPWLTPLARPVWSWMARQGARTPPSERWRGEGA